MDNSEKEETKIKQPFVEITDIDPSVNLLKLKITDGSLVIPSAGAGAADVPISSPSHIDATPYIPTVEPPKRKSSPTPRRQQVVMAISAMFVLLLIGAMLLVALLPQTRSVTIELTLRDRVQYATMVKATPAIIKTIETDVVVDAEQPATGQIMVADVAATGRVSLYNPNGSAVTLSVGTVVATVNGVEYRLTQAVTIPPVTVAVNVPNQTFSPSGGFATGTVIASPAGAKGNLPGGFGKVTIGRGVQVASQGSITGGTDRPAQAATQQDIDQLRQRLTDAAQAKAQETILGNLPQGWQVLATPSTDPKDLSITITQQPGQEASQGKFSGKATAHVTATIYNPQEVLAAAVAQEPALPYEPATDHQQSPVLQQVSNRGDQGLSVQYSRSVVAEKLVSQLDGRVVADRAALQKLMTELTSRQEITAAMLATNLVADYQGQYRVTIKINKK